MFIVLGIYLCNGGTIQLATPTPKVFNAPHVISGISLFVYGGISIGFVGFGG